MARREKGQTGPRQRETNSCGECGQQIDRGYPIRVTFKDGTRFICGHVCVECVEEYGGINEYMEVLLLRLARDKAEEEASRN